MTIFLVSSLALLSGFALALCLAAICLAVIAVDTRNKQNEIFDKRYHQLANKALLEMERVRFEKERADVAEKKLEANVKAIEASSLPWFPKTDKLEARYENEAIDKLENPSFYAEDVPGLGGLS